MKPILLPILACAAASALSGCVPQRLGHPGDVIKITTTGSWRPSPGLQPAPSSWVPGDYDFSGISRVTVDGQLMPPADALNMLFARLALEVGQIGPVGAPLAGSLRIVVPDHDRLRVIPLQAHRGVPGGIVELQTELNRMAVHETADAVIRSRVFATAELAEQNDTASPDPAGADDLLWYEVQSVRPNNGGPWLASWQMRRATGGPTLAVNFDPGTPPGPARLRSFVLAVRNVAATLAGSPEVAVSHGVRPRGHPYSSGTGIVVDQHGHVLTDNHVVNACPDVRVTDAAGGTAAAATLVAHDTRLDLALLHTDRPATAYARFRTSLALRPGEPVVATGFPLAGMVSPEMAVTTGSVTALSGFQGNDKQIEFSAPIQPGNSGGPVLDDQGRVVGVAVGVLNSLALATLLGGTMPENVNFATRADVARAFLAPLQVKLDEGTSGASLNPASIGELARQFTVKVECWK